VIPRFSAATVDLLMCASMNLVQSRHRLPPGSREIMERYVTDCEPLTAHDFYAAPPAETISGAIRDQTDSSVTWPSPVTTSYPENNFARADFYPCAHGWSAPTVFMLHALMSLSDAGYRRSAAHFNARGWNACFVHLPYHHSRIPRGCWNGELAITADLMRNAQGLRQGAMEVRQIMAALRDRGGREFGILGTSYGGWIGALLAMVEKDLRFVALMAPIVNVEHAIWQCPATSFMRRELRRARIEPALIARHFHLSSPMHNEPLCGADRVLFAAGDFDAIVRTADLVAMQERWPGSHLLRVPQGHFGYRMLPETLAWLERHAL
jgi:pimeloyl-ACP methyl ester carboxylesterase